MQNDYQVIPVNPSQAGKHILGQYCYADLHSVEEEVDMVDVFRRSEAVFDIAKDAINIRANVLWTQLGVVDERAALMAKKAGLEVIMDKCPKIELQKKI